MESESLQTPDPTRPVRRRMPAEWEPQACLWLSWPGKRDVWPDNRADFLRDFAALARTAARYQPVWINCPYDAQAILSAALDTTGNDNLDIDLIPIATDDAWCRDHGPNVVHTHGGSKRLAVDWTFNAWGGKFPPFDRDDAAAAKMAGASEIPAERSRLVCEGGALETDGNGLLLTTESVLLNPNRNPGWTKVDVETELKQRLGISEIMWLPGGMHDDDTGGHIDTIARFTSPDTVVACTESAGPNAAALDHNLHRLRDHLGSAFDIVELPLPDPVRISRWRQETLPGTYANFVVLNGAVLVPIYNQPDNDDRALGILREFFPRRDVVAIDSTVFIIEGGSLHCLSCNEPRVR